MMIDFQKARHIVLNQAPRPKIRKIRIEACLSGVLARDFYARYDAPSFNKSIMDGVAVCCQDVVKIPFRLKAVDKIFAGEAKDSGIGKNECAWIATGAAIPRFADAVVKKEDVRIISAQEVEILKKPFLGENILFKAQGFKKGRRLLRKGITLDAAKIALLVSQGTRMVSVYRPPSVALLATGDEIKDVSERLSPGQVWNAVTPLLKAELKSMNIEPLNMGSAPDTQKALLAKIKQGLRQDILITSGAVSVGDRDLIPGVLEKLGFRLLVHRVAIRPGKPFLFAVRGRKLVFGLPGNPLSSFMGFHLFIKPVLEKIMGRTPPFILNEGILKKDVINDSGRLSFLPARITSEGSVSEVEPLCYCGSADLLALASADGFLVLEKECRRVKKGARVRYWRV